MESAENREQPVNNEARENQQLSKERAIALLQETIQQLENIVKNLDASQKPDLKLDSSINTLVTTTKKLAETVTSPAAGEQNTEPILSTSAPETIDTSEPPLPERAIASPPVKETPPTETVRAKSPKPKRNQPLLIGIISGVIIIGAIALWQLRSFQPAELIAQNNGTETETEIVITTDTVDEVDIENIEDGDNLEIVERIDEPKIAVDTTLESEDVETDVIKDLNPDDILAVDIPSELTSPGKAKAIALKPIEPEIILSPEQSLIAAIQARITEITQDYAEDLVTSIQADFLNSNLSVKITNLWYELNESGQNKIANEILKRSRQLDFQKLEITDPEGILVARSPVVGDKAIVLQTTPPEQ